MMVPSWVLALLLGFSLSLAVTFTLRLVSDLRALILAAIRRAQMYARDTASVYLVLFWGCTAGPDLLPG